MKETGMMFKAPLVRSILAGLKTQTRRIAKLPFITGGAPWHETTAPGRTRECWKLPPQPAIKHQLTGIEVCAPFQTGDRIYVRETWAYGVHALGAARDEDGPFVYAADGTTQGRLCDRWRPSIHMPKAVARIWLEVTGVRVERLHSITEADCIAEGAPGGHGAIPGYQYSATPLEHFKHIWESTTGRPSLPANENSKRYARVKHWLDTHPDTTGWAANPWVWVIDFKRIEHAQEEKDRIP